VKIALVTATEARAVDADLPPLVAALAERGAAVDVQVWNDPKAAWDGYDAVVVRSTWDYAPRRDAFVAWAESVRAPLMNGADVLAWNTDKRYLEHLAAQGVPVTPTRFVAPGDLPHDAPTTPEGEIVVKPTISGGAKDTARYLPGEWTRALAHVARLNAAGRTAMVQPYQASVDARGETALLFFGGVFSHAITKGALLVRGAGMVDGLFAPEQVAARAPTDAERGLAEAALDAVPMGRRNLAYARVDVVLGGDGAPLVLELELTEPSVFLDYDAGAAGRFADAILAGAARARSKPA
jgi:glutathione synthase/RimK-type ligase-like ATP-grasp enzyme